MMDAVRRAMAPMRRQISMMIAHATVALLKEGGGLQLIQVQLLDGETSDEVQRFQDYGIVSRPFPDAEAIHLAVGGVRGEGVVICVADRRYRLKTLEEGEVALHDDQGQAVHLMRDRIEIRTDKDVKIVAAGGATVDAETVTVTATDATIDAETVTLSADTATIDASTVNLGGEGGAAVARVGDSVAGGKIVQGSSAVFAA